MFRRWFQDQINKKKSDRPSTSDESQSVEVATDAVIYDGATNNTEEELALTGGNVPSHLTEMPLLDPRQEDPLGVGNVMSYRRPQQTEEEPRTYSVGESPQGRDGCPAKFPSSNLSVDVYNLSSNSKNSLSSMTGTGEVDTHHHYSRENSSNSSNTHKSIEDNFYAQNVVESSFNIQKHNEGSSDSESNSAPQKYIGSDSTTQDHKESVPSSWEHTEYRASIFKDEESEVCHDSSNPQDVFNNASTKSDADDSKLWSSQSLVSAIRKASTESSQSPSYSPENCCGHQKLKTMEESTKNHDEQQNKIFKSTDSECMCEVNVTQKKVTIPHLQQSVTSEKVKDNGHNNEHPPTPAVMGEGVTPEEAAAAGGASEQAMNPEPGEQFECDKGSDKKTGNTKVAGAQIDRSSQTPTTKFLCHNLYCYPQSCLYNQKGKKCTVFGEDFILTYLNECPVLVSTAIQNSNMGPLGCVVVLCSGKRTELRHLPDGTELYFDAIVSPMTPKFVALVIWQGTKPAQCVQPFYDCYIIFELIRNCPVKLVSFGKGSGVVSTLNGGKTIDAPFSKSVLYIDGKETEKVQEIKDLLKPSSKQLYADVLKLISVNQAGNVTYGFMCSCVWLGCKPKLLNVPLFDPFKLYRNASSSFAVANKQALLLCDVDAILEVEDTTCTITFENEGQTTVLSCYKRILFFGNRRAHPVSGRVKVHLRKGFSKKNPTWLVFMVQVQPSLPLEKTLNDIVIHYTTETTDQSPPPQANPAASIPPHGISTKSSSKSAVLPEVTDPQVTSPSSESEIVLRPQYTSTTSVKPKNDKAAATTNNVLIKEDMKSHSESPSISEMDGDNTLEEESQATTTKMGQQVELIVKGKQSSHSEGESSQDNQYTPRKVIRNSSGVLKYISEGFVLETELQGKKVHIEMGETPWVALENGKGKRCRTFMPDLPVGFDAHFVDIPVVGLVGHILALWCGRKPLKASIGSSTYYFDAPAIYHGTDKKGCFEFTVLLQGNKTSITTTSTTAIFEASGEECASLTPLSRVFLHLSLRQDTWKSFLVVLQLKNETSNLIKEQNSLSSESLTKVSNPLNSQAEAKTDNGKPMSVTPKTAREYGFPHYLKNIYGTLTEKDGKRVVITHHKDVPLSVLVPENCLVDVNAVALNVWQIALETKIHVDAFCENIDSSTLSYRAVIAWEKKKARKTVALTGHIFYLNVAAKCWNSNEKEVSIEFTLENKTHHLEGKNAHAIMPDGTWQAPQSLKAGTPVHVNLVQLNQNLSVNQFIYVDGPVPQPKPTPTTVKKNPESTTVTANTPKTKQESKLTPPNDPPPPLIDNLKKSEEESKPPLPVSDGESKPPLPGDEKEETPPINPTLLTVLNEYNIAKGTINWLRDDTYHFIDDKKNMKIKINPTEIAVDANPKTPSGEFYQINANPETPSSEFYLKNASPETPSREFYLVYHKSSKKAMCGWYRYETHQAHLQHGMIVHKHNLESKIITLALPDHSSLYNFLFDSDTTVMGNTGKQVYRAEQLKSGKKVHPIFEDIEPVLIDGCVVSHRIILMTTIKGVSVVCLNFLNHSLFDDENTNLNNESEVSASQAKDKNEPCGDNTGINHKEEERGGATSSLSHASHTDASLTQQEQGKEMLESEGNINESTKFLGISERHTGSEIDINQPEVNELLDQHHEDKLPAVDGEGYSLRELVATKYPMFVTKTCIARYVSLCGEIQLGNSGSYVFYSRKLLSLIQITPNLPHCDVQLCQTKGKRFMLARKMCDKNSGFIDHEPLVVWPQERKCNPYIVVSYKVSRRKNLLLVADAADEKEKYYLFDYNLVFSLKHNYKLNEVIDSYSKQDKMLVLYAVVDKVTPFQMKGKCVEGKILFLTTSKNVAVASIDVFIGSCYQEDLLFQMPLSPVLQMLHLHNTRMARALSCKRGSTYYFTARDCMLDSNYKLVGACLDAYMDDFAVIRCDKKSYTAACHLSNVYYNGENITSWDTISKPHRTNFWAVILPLDDSIEEAKWEVDAVAVVAWSCRGPKVLAMHQCYYHVPTPYVPHLGSVETHETTPTNLVQSLENSSHFSESYAGKGMSVLELESWQCQAGNTIVSFQDDILQPCGLKKMSGKVTLVNEEVVLFTNNENEVVKCKLSDIFIKRKRCESVAKILTDIDKTFTLVAQKCPLDIYLGKCIQMKVIIAFTTSLQEVGIHVCSKHTCILESNLHKEEIAMAQEAFHEIAVWSKYSSQWSDYYLSKIATLEDETPTPPPHTEGTVKHTLCYGFVIDIDKESPEQVRVSLQQGSHSLTLPVSRSRLMGLHKDLSLHHAVGHPLKVILSSIIGSEREENRIVMGWGNFSNDPSNVLPYSTAKSEGSCSPKSKFHCCPRGLQVKEFQDLYNSDMFEVKSLYKLKKIDVESGKGFFHYWLDEKLVTCKIEFIVGWLKFHQVKEELWNLLMAKGPQTGREHVEALAAWQGDCDSLVVEVCDIHGTHGLTVSQEDKTKKGKNSVPSPHKRARRLSEPPQSILANIVQFMPPSMKRRNSADASVIVDVNRSHYNTIQENDAVLSSSLPNRTDNLSGRGLDIRSKEHKKNVFPYSSSIALVSIEEDSVTEEEKVYPPSEHQEPPSHDHPLCSSSVCDENDESVMFSLESEKDNKRSLVKPKLTSITSDSFLCLDSQCGLIIDSLSYTVALVRQGRLYVNKTKAKESLKQLFSTSSNIGIITALVVPLPSPDTLADLKVTHEAVVAWVGSRPAGIGSMIKNICMMPCQSGTKQDKTKEDEEVECNPDMPYNMTDEVTKAGRCNLLTKTVTLKIVLRKLETVFGCFVEDNANHCDILISSTGPVLFDRKLLNVTLQIETTSGIPQSELHNTDNLKALVLELEQPIMVLGFEVNNIGVMVWNEEKPVIDANFVATSLDVYKMNWKVEFIGSFDQLELEDFSKVLHQDTVPSLSYNASEDIQEVVAFYYPTFKEELCTILFIEENYVVFELSEGQAIALWEDIWCQKEILQVGMELQAVCVELSKPLTICTHNLSYFAVLVYVCDQEPEEATTIKSNWRKGTAEKFAPIEGKVDSKKMTINLHVKINASSNTQSKLMEMELLPPSLESMECELLKLMDEYGVLKVKNKEKIKVYFQKNTVLMNRKSLHPQKWKEILQMLMEQKQMWQCNGKILTLQERECIKEKTGEEVQYKAELVWCNTDSSTLPATTRLPKSLSATGSDLGSHATQLTDDTDNNTTTSRTPEGNLKSSLKSSECPSVHSVQPSSTTECVLQNKINPKKNFKYSKIIPLQAPPDTPHPSSLWAARPTMRIILGKQMTITNCIIGTYEDHCGILASTSGPILFYKDVINVTQQEEVAFGTFQTEQNLNALVLELEQPVEILGCEVRKIAMQVWRGGKPEDVDLSKSLDVYKLNWIVVLICNESAVTKKFKIKPIVCHSFEPGVFLNTSSFPEVVYHCSQDYSVRQLAYKFDLAQVAIFNDQDNFVMALTDDVKFSGNCLRPGMYLWVISVKLCQPFRYFSLPITHFGLLVYSEDSPEAATIKYDWSRGEIEKVFSAKRKIGDKLENLNIRITVDKPAKIKPYVMDPLWPIYREKPEGDIIFAVECEVLKLVKNSGLLKATGRLLKGSELLIYFKRNAMQVNSKGLSKGVPLAAQLHYLQNQIWHCTAMRLKPYEIETVRNTMDEKMLVLYKAKLVWCEICPSVQNVQNCENEGVTKACTAVTPPTPVKAGGAEAMTGYGQVEGIEGLCEVDTPLSTGTKPKRKPTKKDEHVKDHWDQEQQSVMLGRLTEVHRTIAQLLLEDGQLKYVARDQCFLFGLCLGKVELWHVLSIGLTMNYELTEDGKELKKVWLGEANPSDPAGLMNTLRDWCLINNVSSSATTALLLEAGWLPSELTPTAGVGDNIYVVEVVAPRLAF